MVELRDGLFDQRAGEFLIELAGLLDAGFQLVAERHQLADLGGDAMLFGKRRQHDKKVAQRPQRDCRLRGASNASSRLLVHPRGGEQIACK